MAKHRGCQSILGQQRSLKCFVAFDIGHYQSNDRIYLWESDDLDRLD